MDGRRLWSAAALTFVVLVRGARGDATDVAATLASLTDAKAECAYVQTLCQRARAAKREAQEAMARSRAYHADARARPAEESGDDARRDGRAVQEHVTAAAQRRADATEALNEAVAVLTARHGRRPACARCRGIAD